MRKFLSAFAMFALATGTAAAQNAPAQPEQAPKAKTVKKTVCQRIEVEGEIGTRLGSATKVCKTIEVPAEQEAQKKGHNHSSTNTL